MKPSRSPFGLFAIGSIAGFLVMGIIAAIIYLPGKMSNSSALNAGDEILARIGKPWSGQAIYSVWDPQSPSPMTLEYAEQYAANYRAVLGNIISSSGEIRNITEQGDFTGQYTDAEYAGEALCEKGRVRITLNIVRRKGTWYLRMIRYESSKG